MYISNDIFNYGSADALEKKKQLINLSNNNGNAEEYLEVIHVLVTHTKEYLLRKDIIYSYDLHF